MNKGEKFCRDGQMYEVLREGIEYVERNREKCIRRSPGSNCVKIKTALDDEIIRKVPSSDSIYPLKRNPEDEPVREVSTNDPEASSLPFEQAEQASDGGICISHESVTAESLEPKPLPPKDDNVYYMPVDNLRAQVYLSYGLIYPGIYEQAGLSADFDDSQRQWPADLTLFEKPQPLKKNQLLLKILLQKEEIDNAQRSGNMLRLSYPLPISRISGIEVPPEVEDLDCFIDGWVKPDVPVPRHLFSISSTHSVVDSKEQNWLDLKENSEPIPSIAESISAFNSYLGVMAFLRNADRYFSDKTGYYADYPDVFFSVCEKVCATLRNSSCTDEAPDPFILSLLGFDVASGPAVEPVLTLVRSQEPYLEKDKVRSLAKEIYQCTGKKESLAQAFKPLFDGDYRSAIQMLQSPDLPQEAAILAALFKFSARQANDHRNVKQRLHEDWSNQSRAYLALAALGAYHGYAAMDAQETALYSAHSSIRPLIDGNLHIKFHLSTIFERQLIEALYRKAFFSAELKHDASELFSGIPSAAASDRPPVQKMLVSDKSYNIQDLLVRRYQVTPIGRIIQKLKAWEKDFIDEKSETGKYLMSQCFFKAYECELSMKGGNMGLRYRIEKSRVVGLITAEEIEINPLILEVTLEEDIGKYPR